LLKKKIRVAPYSSLALIYDKVMSHVNYAEWVDYVLGICSIERLNINKLYDISCGTGMFCKKIAHKGYIVHGSDQSSEMIKVAINQKLGIYTKAPLFWCSSMCDLPVLGKYDLIVSLYDSMNYLMEMVQWEKCLKHVYNLLELGGLFVFDVSTITNSVNFFNNFIQKEKARGIKYTRKSRFDKKTNIQTNYFEIYFAYDYNTIYCEQHEQKIRTTREIVHLIKQSKLQLIEKYDGFTYNPGNDQSDRIHFVLRKES
jgi:2-polyprenyl-3-methyl-5-hydroxy-6-metoxy-1,4-benzoquinol methylase